MPVLWRCPRCRSLVSLSKKVCSGCETKRPKNGKCVYVVQVCYRKKRRSATVTSLSQARELEIRLKNELVSEFYNGPKNKKPDPTFEEFYQKMFLPWANTHLKFEKGKIYFSNWIVPFIGRKKLSEISVLDVEKIKTSILKAGRAPRTAQHVVALVRAAFNRAISWGFAVEKNPASGVKVPRFDNRRVRFLSQDEAKRLLDECHNRTTPRNWIYQMTLLALTTGMRAGEIFRLRVQDLDFERGIAHVRDAKSGENGIVYLSQQMKEVLSPLIKGKKPHEYVFTKPDGRPFSEVPDVWKNIIRDLKFNEGVTDPREKVVFHTLRHTFCSWLALEGVPLHVIKELARHKTIQMTERYAHLMPDVKRKAVVMVWDKLKGEEAQ